MIINLTPHDITLKINGSTIVFSACDPNEVCRISQTEIDAGFLQYDQAQQIPLYSLTFGDPDKLPKPQQDTYYIVSTLVMECLINKGIYRSDLLVPARQIRDELGHVTHCEGFRVMQPTINTIRR